MDSSGRVRDGEAPVVACDAEDAAVEDNPAGESEPAESLLELVLAAHEARVAEQPLPPRVDGVVLGRVVSLDETGMARVAYPGAPEGGAQARMMAAVSEADVGREAALLFEGGDRDKPVIMGLLFEGGRAASTPAVFTREEARATVDGERIVLSADREIVLECGEASITLTRAGKILIKGTYVLSRSSGTNKIQGGSVQIN